MLLIYPPTAKICEPPAGIARLAGTLRAHGLRCTLLDANLEAQRFLIETAASPGDTWSRRAVRNKAANLAALRTPEIYTSADRYRRAVADCNRLLELQGNEYDLDLSLANYQDRRLSPLKSRDLLRAAREPEKNIFFRWFSVRLASIIEAISPRFIGFSLNYLSQALTSFAMIGWLKRNWPNLPVILGGGLVTSWMSGPDWRNPFAGLVDHLMPGQGERPLLRLFEKEDNGRRPFDYDGLPLQDYLAPGFILPYAASSGCWWNRCSFCPEAAEKNPFSAVPSQTALRDIRRLADAHAPVLLHLLDNAVSPALMKALSADGPAVPWYGFARTGAELTDPDFCRALQQSGCRMLKLGIESGDQGVLDAMEKGTDLETVSKALRALADAGIATYVYLLFGTPAESEAEARKTLEFIARDRSAVTFLNLAIFNMPVGSSQAADLPTDGFYEGDLSLYTDFAHPRGWGRKEVRRFLDQEFRRHPAIAPIIRNDPPLFTSNHAPFFSPTVSTLGNGKTETGTD